MPGNVDEMEQRATGMTYLEIFKNGGGILSTVKATRKASEKSLFDMALSPECAG